LFVAGGVNKSSLKSKMYVIGGYDGEYLKRVHRPSDGVRSSIPDMELCQFCPGNYNNFIFKISFVKLYLI